MELQITRKTILPMVLLFFSSILQSNCAKPKNNVCSSNFNYFFMQHSSKCWYDFAESDKAPNIIVKSGYPFREYKIVTEDDYILTVFRIPSENVEKGAAFLQHGIESSGKMFTSLGNKSLAFLLADVGYDVWIGNYRGTEYSEGHKYLDVSMEKYWDYSVDDVALKDLPAMINLVKLNTPIGDKIVYVGHSWGATFAMMYCSEHQQQCRDIFKHFFWLAPVYKLKYMKSPYRVIFPYGRVITKIATTLHVIPQLSSGFKTESRTACLSTPVAMQFCHLLYKIFFGIRSEIRPQTVPILINQILAGTAFKAAMDFLKYSTEGEFRKYDYGSSKNMDVYGSEKPPDYDITTLNVNVSLFYSTCDWSAGDKDAEVLYNTLPEKVRYGNHKINQSNFNHLDFMMGPSAKELIYDVILEELKSLG